MYNCYDIVVSDNAETFYFFITIAHNILLSITDVNIKPWRVFIPKTNLTKKVFNSFATAL